MTYRNALKITLRADSQRMQCDSPYPKENSDAGFGLVEAVIATALFVVLLVISIGPIMSSLNRLDSARLNTEGEKLAEAQLESIRALDFDDVGLTSGNPSGVISPSLILSGPTGWKIDTNITWEGAITGIDTANYKLVDIVVTHPDGTVPPIAFSSIIAPDRLLDSSNKASVSVDLVVVEPSPSGAALPKVFLVKTNGSGVESGSVFPLAGALPTEFEFPLLNPTDDNPGDPNYEMVMRLGPTLADTSSGGWYINPTTLSSGSDTFRLFEAQILDTVLPIYRPAILEVFVEEDIAGDPINNASLTLFNGTDSEIYTTTDGHFYITSAYGYLLAPDDYDITVAAAGFAAETRASVNIPAGYPTPLHTETFELAIQIGDPVAFRVRESSYRIPNATISIPGLPDAVTNDQGEVTVFVPTGTHTATITNTVGFDTEVTVITNLSGFVDVFTSTPSNSRVVHLYNGGGGDHWGFRDYGDVDAYEKVPRDSDGNGVFAVIKDRWYDTALICSDDTVGKQVNKYVDGTEWVSYGGNGC